MLRRAVAWLVVVVAIVAVVGSLGYYKYAANSDRDRCRRRLSGAAGVRGNGNRPSRRMGGERQGRGHRGGATPGRDPQRTGGHGGGDRLQVRRHRRGRPAAGPASIPARSRRAWLRPRPRRNWPASPSSGARSCAPAQTVSRAGVRQGARGIRRRQLRARRTCRWPSTRRRILAPFRARIGITDLQPGAYLDVGSSSPRCRASATTPMSISLCRRTARRRSSPAPRVTLSTPQMPEGGITAKVIAEDASVDGANRTVRFRAVAKGLGETLRPGSFVDVSWQRQRAAAPCCSCR